MNLPAYNAMVGNLDGMNNTRFNKIMIKLHNPKDIDDITKLKKAFKENFTAD